jgi:hypothetical protein
LNSESFNPDGDSMNNFEFISSFRNAANMLGPWEYDNPPFGRDELDDFALRSHRLWWRPESVNGLDPDSFKKLSDADRTELAENKQKFLETFDITSGSERERILRARDAFLAIYKRVGDLLTRHEVVTTARILHTIIRDQKYSNWFITYAMEFSNDWAGDPAIQVTLFVDDSRAEDPLFLRNFPKYVDWIHDDLRNKGVSDRHVYITARTVSEQYGRIVRGAA